MHPISELRTKLNCSKEDFSKFLGTSRSTIFRIESGKGDVPSFAIVPLMAIGNRIHENEERGVPTVQSDKEERLAMSVALNERNVVIGQLMSKYETSLSDMTPFHDDAVKALSHYTYILSNPEDLNSDHQRWIRSQCEIQKAIIQKNGPFSRYQIQVKMAQLRLELEMNAAAIG